MNELKVNYDPKLAVKFGGIKASILYAIRIYKYRKQVNRYRKDGTTDVFFHYALNWKNPLTYLWVALYFIVNVVIAIAKAAYRAAKSTIKEFQVDVIIMMKDDKLREEFAAKANLTEEEGKIKW